MMENLGSGRLALELDEASPPPRAWAIAGDGRSVERWRRRLDRRWHFIRHLRPAMVLCRIRHVIGHRLADAGLWPASASLGGQGPGLAAPLPRSVVPAAGGQIEGTTGELQLRLPWGARPLGNAPDWHAPATTPVEASWRTRLHYMEYLPEVDDRRFQILIRDWIRANPQGRRGAWRYGWRPYDLSIRSVVWLQEIARRQDRLAPDFLAEAEGSLRAQLRFLARHVETDLRGNHLIKNLKALLWASACLAGPEARQWAARGEALLAAELHEQILPDGTHYERSPSYHCQVLADLLDCRQVLPPGPLRRRLDEVLPRMARAAAALTHPDGGVALFNDSGLGLASSTATLLRACSELTGIAVAGEPAIALADAGYFGWRRNGDHLLVDCGPPGPDYLLGHAHGDILSFEWSLDGQRIIVDQGTFQYEAGPRRTQSRSTLGHNTVSIDGLEQSDFYGAFRCGRRARAEVLEYRPTARGFVLEGTHDGFDHLSGAPRHVRRMELDGRQLLVHDRIAGGGEHPAEARFLLHPEVDILPGAQSRELQLRRAGVQLLVQAETPIRIEAAEWYPDLYVSRPATRLVIPVAPGGMGSSVRWCRLA